MTESLFCLFSVRTVYTPLTLTCSKQSVLLFLFDKNVNSNNLFITSRLSPLLQASGPRCQWKMFKLCSLNKGGLPSFLPAHPKILFLQSRSLPPRCLTPPAVGSLTFLLAFKPSAAFLLSGPAAEHRLARRDAVSRSVW